MMYMANIAHVTPETHKYSIFYYSCISPPGSSSDPKRTKTFGSTDLDPLVLVSVLLSYTGEV